MDADKSQKWFSELWNGAIVPYLSQMNKELTVQVCVVSCFLCVVLKRPFCGHVPHFPSGHSSKENLFRRMGLFSQQNDIQLKSLPFSGKDLLFNFIGVLSYLLTLYTWCVYPGTISITVITGEVHNVCNPTAGYNFIILTLYSFFSSDILSIVLKLGFLFSPKSWCYFCEILKTAVCRFELAYVTYSSSSFLFNWHGIILWRQWSFSLLSVSLFSILCIVKLESE